MSHRLFGVRKQAPSSARVRFRPTLEALEARDVPTVTNPLVQQVEAAIQEINATLPLLQNNVNLNNPNNGNAQIKIIINDLNVLALNAPKFDAPSRFQIDVTQVQAGVQLFQDGALLTEIGFPKAGASFQSTGLQSVLNGLADYLSSQGGMSSGNLSLS